MAGAKKRSGGKRPGSGRKKGTPNKINADVKAMILEALSKSGGVDYLVRCSKTNRNAFLALLGRVLPMTVAGDPNNPIEVKGIEIRIVDPRG